MWFACYANRGDQWIPCDYPLVDALGTYTRVVAPGRPGAYPKDVLYLLNLWTGNPASSVFSWGLDTAAASVVPMLGVRPVLANQGGTIGDKALYSQIADYCAYADKAQLLSGQAAMQRLLWVENVCDYEAIAEAVQRRGCLVDFYQQSPALNDLFGDSCLYPKVVASRAETFSDKVLFKDLAFRSLEEFASPEKTTRWNDYPRIVVNCDESLETIRYKLKTILDATPDADRLFIVGRRGAGGFRNFILDRGSPWVIESSSGVIRRELEGPDDLADFFVEEHLSAEVAPFLPIEADKSFSFGLVLTDDKIVVCGPRYQVLSESLQYRGFWIDSSHLPPGVSETPAGVLTTAGGGTQRDALLRSNDSQYLLPAHIDSEWGRVLSEAERLSVSAAKALHREGYRGALSVDFFVFRRRGVLFPLIDRVVTAVGSLMGFSMQPPYSLNVAEANMRKDGNTHLLAFLASLALNSRGRALRAVQGIDHQLVAETTLPRLLERLERYDVPLFTRSSLRGVLLLSFPFDVYGEGMSACVGFVGENGSDVASIVASFERANGRKPQ